MKEVTRIYTLQLTFIEEVSEEELATMESADAKAKELASILKGLLKADDAIAMGQDFVFDKE